MNNETTMQTVPLGIRELHESIRANISTILLTGRGEIPFRPRFGLGAERLLGGGMATVDLAYEVAEQLTRYEKRIQLKQVTQQEIEPGHCRVTIRYAVLATGEEDSLTL